MEQAGNVEGGREAGGSNIRDSRGSNVEQDIVEAPEVGMIFKGIDELYEFYKAYARLKGFGIAKRGARKDERTGDHRWMTIKCSRGGVHKPRGKNLLLKSATGKNGCGARISCVKTEGHWVISRVVLEHNHEVSPENSRFIRQHRVVDVLSRTRLETNDMAGIRPCDNVKAVVFEAGGHEELPCLDVDLRNHIQKVRRLQLGRGDAEAVHKMFGELQTESRDFVYVIKPDKEGRLKHVFWADGRCREAYREFSDVVTFDTTYLINKYDMPFGAFVGVNHHGQSILLGCALLNNEKTKTYRWLFQTWLKYMDDKQPDAIITDQCQSIGEAINIVFPNSRHRLCLWHILCKFLMKMARISEYGSIKDAFMDVVYDSVNNDEFEMKWGEMLSDFPALESNAWIGALYESRHQWAPVYVKSFFWAGMSSTQRSESMHSFLDGYVNSRTTLKKFVEQYQLAVQTKVEKETHQDFKSANTQIPCVTRWSMEMQLRDAYTNKIFKLVQHQLTDLMYCDVKISKEEGSKREYEVTEVVSDVGMRTIRKRLTVQYDGDMIEVQCDCRLFEFKGIMCAHAFKVLMYNDVAIIPDRYILRRWRKDVVRPHTRMKIGASKPCGELRRRKEMERIFYTSLERAINDPSKYEFMIEGLKRQKEQLLSWSSNGDRVDKDFNGENDKEAEVEDGEEGIQYRDPNSVRRRGRPKKKRLLAAVERITRSKSLTRSNKRRSTQRRNGQRKPTCGSAEQANEVGVEASRSQGGNENIGSQFNQLPQVAMPSLGAGSAQHNIPMFYWGAQNSPWSVGIPSCYFSTPMLYRVGNGSSLYFHHPV